jgi:hypothetical protein
MNRRKFTVLAGGAVAWPHLARGQQGDQMRHIGILLPAPTGDARQPSALVLHFRSGDLRRSHQG